MKKLLILPAALGLLSGCNKANYLDVNASQRPPLAANVRFVNARTVSTPVNFWTFTTQVTSSPLAPGQFSTYLSTQYGNVQINLTEGSGSSYKVSQQFGNSATFSASGGPNGPIPDFFHTVFAVRENKSAADSLILFYDNLAAPAAGKAKLRFVNLSPDTGALNLSGDGVSFRDVAYGRAANSAISGEKLSAYSLGPFEEVAAGSRSLQVTTAAGQVLATAAAALQEGKAYTVFTQGTATVRLVILPHN